jgi:hypothetical protein
MACPMPPLIDGAGAPRPRNCAEASTGAKTTSVSAIAAKLQRNFGR